MIKLRQLLNEETFTATNKASGKTSVFKSKDSRDNAIKAGTHNPIKDKGDSNSKGSETPKVNIFDKPAETPKSEPNSEPAKKRPGNPQVNKATKSKAEELGVTPQKLGNKEYPLRMLQAAYEALTDSNYHTEARELIAKIEGKPEMAEKPDYPSMRDPQYKEKMAAISQKYASKYSDDVDDNARELGISASQESGWDGVQAADAIAFTLRMNGFHKQADMIQSIFDDKPYMKAMTKEGRISLSNMVNELETSEGIDIAHLTGLRPLAVQKFIDDNNIDARKLQAYLRIKGPKTLSNRMDIATAIVGKPNNKFAQGIIKAFQKK
jgi:hypothetical protein